MKKTQDNRTTYTIGLVRGAVLDGGEEGKRGDVIAEVNVNTAAILQAVNRARVLGTSAEKKADVEDRVKTFKAEVAAEDKAIKAHADEQIAAGANLAAQVKALQAELANLRKAIV